MSFVFIRILHLSHTGVHCTESLELVCYWHTIPAFQESCLYLLFSACIQQAFCLCLLEWDTTISIMIRLWAWTLFQLVSYSRDIRSITIPPWAGARVYLSCSACCWIMLRREWLLWLKQLFLHMFWKLLEAHFIIVFVSNELTNFRPLVICGIVSLNSMNPVMRSTLGSTMGLSLNFCCSLKHTLSLFFLSLILATSLSNNSVVASKLYHFFHGFIVNFLKDGVAKCDTHVWCTQLKSILDSIYHLWSFIVDTDLNSKRTSLLTQVESWITCSLRRLCTFFTRINYLVRLLFFDHRIRFVLLKRLRHLSLCCSLFTLWFLLGIILFIAYFTISRFGVFTPDGTQCVAFIKQPFLLSLPLEPIFFTLSFNFIDKVRYVNSIVLHHDLGWFSGLLKITWHQWVHLKYTHEAFLVSQIVVLLFYLLGRLIDG